MAATVIKPRGGNSALRSTKANAFSKDQKLLGNRGYNSKTLMQLALLMIGSVAISKA
jgi:hypothetical protein